MDWLRFAIPPGATQVDADVHGDARLFVDGDERELGRPLPEDDPAPPARAGALRIVTRPGHEGGAALAGPIRFTTGPGTIALGDWQAQGLPEYSGGVRYRTRLTARDAAAAGTRTVLDLGRVRGTAEVHVDGAPAGVRVCAPWTFDVTDLIGSEDDREHVVEVLVLGTLGPYLDAVSPTHFVFDGQCTSGLLGPVTLRRTRGS